jgi:hypothetical protein
MSSRTLLLLARVAGWLIVPLYMAGDAAFERRIHREFTPLIYNCQKNHMDEEHPAKRKKSRWRPTSRGAMRIFAVLIAVGALLVVFRGYYLEYLHDRPRAILGAAAAVAAVVVLIRVGQQYKWTGFGESVQPKSDDQEIQARKTL